MWDILIVNPMTNLLLWIYDVVGHNFGVAIILFTLLIRLLTWPLNAQQMKGAQSMQEFQNDKEWQAIQKKYAKDREKLAQEQMRIYRERGINPFASCLPTLIQLPILFGLFQAVNRALSTTPLGLLELGRSLYPFLNAENIIPLNSRFLWMNLGQPETLLVLGVGIPTLAILVAITSYMQAKLTMPAPSNSNPNDQAAAMGNSMAITMPLMMGWFALTWSSGVALYLLTTNLLGILQYAMMGKANWRNLLPGAGAANAARKN
jgi:YidC/Oxa1 family membrane protein insertase